MKMEFDLDIAEKLDKKFKKLAKKDKNQMIKIDKKIQEILINPYHYKPLRGDLHGSKRVHIGHFVLVFEIDEKKNVVRLLDYDHHDYIY